MTAETRAALIAESNRLIAARAAKASARSAEPATTGFGTGAPWSVWGSMPYATQAPTTPRYQGLMRLFASTRR